ncbi:DUF732 domain-containing protein [Mycolicibacterium flavescens]|uniref:DUF732 domain-containing protein n=1 Tax=Mycolicibacterium flavescens TaxID=1776 RepID=A0A1E3RRN9_MYCFV|nr:DUF732 domain-containing protein [Mycolicibacterium flavescens]MCV7279915.1 DUF732 domain-containing protein [Mycolicibacterium flavescens]ODQ92529.1 hypothetical protein BHQ18_02035 [Mycolicibacterium flavescens]
MAVLTKILVLSAATALIGAPVAAASPESDFCASMAGAGFTGDCATITTLARDVCTQTDRGVDLDTLLAILDQATRDENLSNYVVAGARLYFCPPASAT